MHISFNMVTAGGSTSGVYSYVIKMAIDFPRSYPDSQFTLFITPDLYAACNQSLPNVKLVVCKFASKTALKRMLWEQFLLPIEIKKLKIDLVYTFSVTDIFLAPCPTIIRVGNMLPYSKEAMKYQTGIKSKFRLNYLRLMLRLSVITSNATLVMSEAAANILVSENQFPKEKIKGINRGISFNSIQSDIPLDKDLPSDYILVLSHIQEHKRLEEIVLGYSLEHRDIPLVFLGAFSNKAYFEKLNSLVKELDLNDRVLFLGAVDRSELFQIIKPANIVIFPSMVETYPSTLLEPMFVGSAMIVSDLGVMPALCGDSVLYYDPRSADELCKQISTLLGSETLRIKMKTLSAKRLDDIDTSWDIAIKKRYELFTKVVLDNSK